ncbi:undecaprenol kinase [Chlorobaculum parvum NCIB 8327]|uniref:Undecaprenyl-diphosphatase n=1 Tax=Chlorobaculum parvum (strain DSM 263 / NCIMB 8327) TaxID=517417 RepID=UPPP_CHLP8|nr:undecaprenyl-diphosphate phosphatase [Chlorobaculum parvum]B3QQ95.1 RecName: Full=Undecaprenyl-diphosphatase; AltName: Full=Bacitracin resistance protein; AltName: Full=Undecaprenyl pyrophosphate phosphatase [Chlorobaculum parvum NCIB 8327]ACF12098.1 undecaprenol kinase [Chlorobaculum parvum NCIB 8327]
MNLFQAIILGIVQGLTEFLPISSSAHLRIVPALAGWDDPGAAFTAIVQIGTLAAVLIYFMKDIISIVGAVVSDLLKGKPLASDESRTGWMIAAGTIPIVVFGLAFKDDIETTLRSLYWVSAALIALALVLSIAEKHTSNRARQGRRGKAISEITWLDAMIIGFAQAMALIPGSSRSGVTITAGLFRNLDRETSARFSFLLSLPSVFAAGIYQLYKTWDVITASTDNMINIAVATVFAFIFGYLSIAFLLTYLKRHSTGIFIGYRLLLGISLIIMIGTGHLMP